MKLPKTKNTRQREYYAIQDALGNIPDPNNIKTPMKAAYMARSKSPKRKAAQQAEDNFSRMYHDTGY